MAFPFQRAHAREWTTLALVGVLTASPTAQRVTAPPAAPPVDRAVPFRVGESLTFDVGWASFLTAGSATMKVAERRTMADGHSAYYLVAEGKPTSLLNALYHVYYKADALLDTQSLSSVESSIFSDERGMQRTRITRFLPSGTSIEYEQRTPAVTKDTRNVPRFTLDALSTVYVMRALPLSAGQSMTTPVTDEGRTYQMRVKVSGPETIKTSFGAFAAWKLTSSVLETGAPAAQTQHVTAWISNDARRLPLKLEIAGAMGNFALTLVSVTGG